MLLKIHIVGVEKGQPISELQVPVSSEESCDCDGKWLCQSAALVSHVFKAGGEVTYHLQGYQLRTITHVAEAMDLLYLATIRETNVVDTK